MGDRRSPFKIFANNGYRPKYNFIHELGKISCVVYIDLYRENGGFKTKCQITDIVGKSEQSINECLITLIDEVYKFYLAASTNDRSRPEDRYITYQISDIDKYFDTIVELFPQCFASFVEKKVEDSDLPMTSISFKIKP